jgi:Bacterial Ig-like domain (group 3)/FG-GAP-like repeat
MFPERLDRQLRRPLHPRPQSSNTLALLGKLATRTLLFVVALAFLQGIVGVQEASSQVAISSEGGQYVLPIWAWKEITNLCGEPPDVPKADPVWTGCFTEAIRMLGLGGGPAGKFSAPRIRHASPGATEASGTSSLTLSSGTPYLPFLGNTLVGLSFVPNSFSLDTVTAVYATDLRRQSDCSLYEDFVLPTATTPSTAVITSLPAAQDYFHQLSGLPTKPDVFKNGCNVQVLGLPATGNILLLGNTSDGAVISAQLANAGLYVTITDPTANTTKNTQVTSGSAPGYFSAASLRNNGNMDLVETGLVDPANQKPATAVLLGNGDGTFKAAVYYDVADTTGNVAGFTIDDVNGDGIPDIVVPTITSTANPGVVTFTGNVTTLLGKGDGTFTTGPVSALTWTNSLLPLTGDFNGDGKKDLLIGGTVLFGGGDGTFTAGPTNSALAAALTSNTFVGAAADLSNNGKLDVVISVPGSVAIFNGNGDGTFQTGPVYAGLPDSEQVTITDIDGDGNPDIFLGTSNGGLYTLGGYDTPIPFFQVLMGRGDGTFVDSALYQQGTYNLPGSSGINTGSQIAIADFNGDSKADLLVLNRNNVGTSPSSLVMLPGDGKGNLGTPVTSSANLGPIMVIAADMNNDQKPDAVLIGLGTDENPKVSVLINQGNGTFAAEQDYTLAATATSLAVGDFNGDGLMDVAVGEGSSGVFVLLGQSNGTLGTAKMVDPSNASDLVAGSLTGNGRADLVVVDAGVAGTQQATGALVVYLGNADGSFTAATAPTTSATNYTVAALGDLNHDGILDLIVTGAGAATSGSASTPNVYTLLGKGDGTFATANTQMLGGADGVGATSIAIADLNKDGNLDVAAGNPNDYTEVLLGNGDGTLSGTLLALGQRPATVATADLLGNSYPEVLVGQQSGGVAVFLNSTVWTSTTTPPALAATTTALSASAATITVGASVTFTATVSGPAGDTTVPTGTVTFMEGTATLGTGTLSATGVATYATTALPTGADSITAVYGGDGNFSGSTSSAVTVTVNAVPPGFALSSSGNITESPGATTGNGSTISVTGSGGFAGAVALTCSVSPAAASDPATCSVSPASVTISGATAQTSTLTVVTTAATSAALVHPKAGGVPWYAAAGATLACVLFFGIPARRRGWQTLLGMLILLVFASTFLVGCGGGGGGSGGSGGSSGGGSTPANPGTTAGAYKVTVTGTSGSIVETATVTLTVN